MTLSELLEELKAVDPETWDAIVRGIPLKPFCQYFTVVHGEQIMVRSPAAYLPFSQMERDVALIWLHGSLQQACERRGWTWRLNKLTPADKKTHCGEIGEIAPGYEGDYYEQYHEYCMASVEMDSAAEALLAAYIAAVKGEKK